MSPLLFGTSSRNRPSTSSKLSLKMPLRIGHLSGLTVLALALSFARQYCHLCILCTIGNWLLQLCPLYVQHILWLSCPRSQHLVKTALAPGSNVPVTRLRPTSTRNATLVDVAHLERTVFLMRCRHSTVKHLISVLVSAGCLPCLLFIFEDLL
jgi:hypothetical protein